MAPKNSPVGCYTKARCIIPIPLCVMRTKVCWQHRMRTTDMLKVAEGFARNHPEVFSMEIWGGATFDVCMRFPEGESVGDD